MPITVLPPRQTGLGAFSEAMNPYLQLAFQTMLQQQMKKPEEERAKSAEERAAREEMRKTTEAISAGKIPITSPAVTEEMRKGLIRGPQIEPTGLTGKVGRLKDLPYTAQIAGAPEFLKRVTPAETPQAAQARMRTAYQTAQGVTPSWFQEQENRAVTSALNIGRGTVAKGAFGALETLDINSYQDALDFISYKKRDPAMFEAQLSKYRKLGNKKIVEKRVEGDGTTLVELDDGTIMDFDTGEIIRQGKKR